MMGTINELKPIEPFANLHDNYGGEHEESQGEEKQEEPLSIMTKVAPIILFVSVPDFLAFLNEQGIDLTDMLLHLGKHPFVFPVELVLNFLPVSIRHIH